MSLVTPEFGLLFWMVVIFGIVFFLLAKFGFPVITDMVDERSAKIAKSLKDADEIEARMAAWKEEQAKLVEETRRQQAAILKNATETKAKIVADAKYIPLIKDELSAEKAAPVYYKTIMYMYRFNANKGFLFHPVSKKMDEETGEIVAVDDRPYVDNDYTIKGRPDCHLYKLGLVVADNVTQKTVGDKAEKKTKLDDAWKKFRDTMNDREEKFVTGVNDLIVGENTIAE